MLLILTSLSHQMWGANMDWQLILDPGMVIDYMTKYVTKSDMSSNKACTSLMKSLFDKTVTEEGRSVQSLLRRIMSKLLGERMISKQEKCHLMLGISIVFCSHSQVNIDLEDEGRLVIVQNENENNADPVGDSILEEQTNIIMSRVDAYANRLDSTKWSSMELFNTEFNEDTLQSMSLLQFSLKYKVTTRGSFKNKITLDSGKTVINFYPSVPSDPKHDRHAQYCKYALMRFRPWVGQSANAWDQSTTDEEVIALWKEFCCQWHRSDANEFDTPDFLQRALNDHVRYATRDSRDFYAERNEESSFQSDNACPRPGDDPLCDNQVDLAQLLLDRDIDDIDTLDIDWDQTEDWTAPPTSFEANEHFVTNEVKEKVQIAKEQDGASANRRRVLVADLNAKQRIAHDMMVRACAIDEGDESETEGGTEIGRLQILLGAGGTGKSFVIDAVITTLADKYGWNDEQFSIHATTGKAATNIGGTTIQNYSTGLGFNADCFRPLGSQTLLRFQEKWKKRKLIIIDEFSMLKQKELYYLDQRLKQIMNSLLPFGGLVVVLAGDPAQLPAVKGNCLWHENPRNGTTDLFGRLLYKIFTAAVILTENKRIDFTDPGAVRYEQFLNRLRNGNNTIEDWHYIRNIGSRDSISTDAWRDFEGDDVVHLYPTNKEVNERNIECLQRNGNPIVRIDALHTGAGKRASSQQARNLESKAYLCRDAFVLLTQNIWQSAGLCNGATGKVIDFVFSIECPPPGLPEYIIVDFGENYSGPPIFGENENRKGWFPIFPECATWESSTNQSDSGSRTDSRTMIPLKLCYAWTIWKCQGQTISSKVVVSLGKREREHGLTYTAFSRVRRATDIGIINGFPRDRLLTMIAKQAKMKPRIKEEKRLKKIAKTTETWLQRNAAVEE